MQFTTLLTSRYRLQLADNSNQQLRNIALDALDQSICAVLGSEQFQNNLSSSHHDTSDKVRTLACFNNENPIFYREWKLILLALSLSLG